MTINSVRYVDMVNSSKVSNEKREPKPPPRIWHAVEAPFKRCQLSPTEGHQKISSEAAIVIDNGSSKPSVNP